MNAQRRSRGMRGALLIHNLGAGKVWVVNATPLTFDLRERPSTHCSGGWLGLGASLEGYEKSLSTEV
jgi:hypothetical protein